MDHEIGTRLLLILQNFHVFCQCVHMRHAAEVDSTQILCDSVITHRWFVPSFHSPTVCPVDLSSQINDGLVQLKWIKLSSSWRQLSLVIDHENVSKSSECELNKGDFLHWRQLVTSNAHSQSPCFP